MLQTFMEALYTELTGLLASDLKCGELKLETNDIDTLQRAVKRSALPHYEGVFFDEYQFLDKVAAQFHHYDLEFCAWARAEIAQDSNVIYFE